MNFTTAVITNAGFSNLTAASSNQGTLTITRVKLGSGVVTSQNVYAMTDLITNKWSVGLAGINNLVNYQVTIQITVDTTASGFPTFQFNEAGIMATFTPTGGTAGSEFLLAYFNTSSGDTLTANTSVDQYTLGIPWSNAANITANITVTQTVNLHAANHLDNGTDPIPVATSARTGSMWKLSGVASQFANGVGGWSNTLPVITSNLSLTVISSGTPDNVTTFASIQAAHDYLLGFQIYPGVIVTINVQAGTYTTNTAITIKHPQGQQIQIKGAVNTSVSISSVGTISGSSGSWSVPLTLSSASGISVGSWLLLNNLPTGNASRILIGGCVQVSAVSGSVVTVTSKYTGSSFPAVGSVTSGTVTLLSTVVSCGSSNMGFNFSGQGNGIGLISNIALIGQNASGYSGLNASGPISVQLQNCGFYGWGLQGTGSTGAGVYANSNASVTIIACGASHCSIGFGATISGSLTLQGCYVTNCYSGMSADECGILQTLTYSGVACQSYGCTQGCSVTNGSHGFLSPLGAAYNTYGVMVGNKGSVVSQSGFYSSNTTFDVWAYSLSIFNNYSGGNTIGTMSPSAANTVGNNGSYITNP